MVKPHSNPNNGQKNEDQLPDLQKLSEAYENLKEVCAQKDQELSKVQTQLTTEEKKYKDLTKENSKLLKKYDEVLDENENYFNIIKKLEGDLTAIKEERNAFKVNFETAIKDRDTRPNITLEEWNEDYSQRPIREELTQANVYLQKERDNVATLTEDLEKTQKDLTAETAKLTALRTAKAQVEVDLLLARTDLKDFQKQVDNLTVQLAKATKDLQQTKETLTEGETDHLATKEALQKAEAERDSWQKRFTGLTVDQVKAKFDESKGITLTKEEQKKLTDYDLLEKELKTWQSQFTGKTPTEIQEELNKKQLTAEQRSKLTEYDKIKKERDDLFSKVNQKPKETLTSLSKKISDEIFKAYKAPRYLFSYYFKLIKTFQDWETYGSEEQKQASRQNKADLDRVIKFLAEYQESSSSTQK